MLISFSDILSASLFLLSSTSVHISFTQLLMFTSPLPELSGQGERSELDLLPCREQGAGPGEAVGLCLCAFVCAHLWQRHKRVCYKQHWFFYDCWWFNHSLAGMLECICLKANRAPWPALSRTKTQAQCLASARALCSRQKRAQAGRLLRDRDKKNPAWKCWI